MAALCFLNVMAQEKKTVTGVVQDSKGAAVEGATITELGTRNTVVTKSDGSFTISVKENATLVITSIGFGELQLKTGSASSYTISLQEKVTEVDEVVVTALGISKESKKLGYQVQKVEAKDLVKVAPPNLSQGLMGKVAGLNITVPNGVEGSSQRIVIRGNNVLFGNNQPLFVVDGVQMSDGQMGLKHNSGSGFDIRLGKSFKLY